MPKEPISVMIVEDDEVAAKIYKQFTHKLDQFSVIATASSGEQALELLQIFTPKLILLDVFLPDINGIDLLWEIRKKHRTIDVILITAANDTETISEAIRGGAFGYLIKPIIIDKLLSTLKQYELTRIQLYSGKVIDQDKVDFLFHTNNTQNVREEFDDIPNLPKGIDKHTLKIVRNKVQEIKGSLNADELGQIVGISYSTMRRYLEYLVSCDEMEVEISYGAIGRPERKYKPKNSQK
ncbi:response regulator [Priestia megaterium]|uniref:response regulator n=1 Tax=Priestia megaterium TaxID=1404 RepID=UPI0021BE977E|nr:response regulator [Priestia megaterium]MCT9853345.1 response regulator [Priestia megaterium]MDF1964398.1 response regulator [Priestia megaterium]